MPEGHTIHRYARDHGRLLCNQNLTVSSPQGRFAHGARLIDGRCLRQVEACGKHLFYVFAGQAHEARVVHVHLGLYGRFRVHEAPPPDPRGQIRMRMVGQSQVVDLSGPTRCEVISWSEAQARMNKLGPDPLRADSDPERFIAALSKTRRALGATLLDQSIIAGVGNIYRAELLFHHQLNPWMPSRDLNPVSVKKLWDTAKRWLEIGVQANRIITTTDVDNDSTWDKMSRAEALAVYGQKVCVRCSQAIERGEQAGRILYWCPSCQSGSVGRQSRADG